MKKNQQITVPGNFVLSSSGMVSIASFCRQTLGWETGDKLSQFLITQPDGTSYVVFKKVESEESNERD